jgi:uncharacterized PurR-regulated membrane protein YhhQ (DUF165 family)
MKTYAPLATLYVGVVVLANWLASKYIVHVPFTPYLAPAGVFAIGGILVLRDWLQQIHGLWKTMPLVYIAGLISWLVGDLAGWTPLQRIAIASIVAFTVSETVEALIFTPIRKVSLTIGVGLSAVVGVALDSWIFLTIAFSSLAFFWGQFWGKMFMVILGVILTFFRRAIFRPIAA